MTAMRLLSELMAPFVSAPPMADAGSPPAKAANSANRKDWRGFPAESGAANGCEDLRIGMAGGVAFAEIRSPSQVANRPDSKQACGLSQDSQDSQGWTAVDPSALALVAWTDADIARYVARRDRLLRWGWREPEAEATAERLVRRDREADPRVTCAECQHYRPGRCANHRRAGLVSAEVGRELAGLLQHCAGFTNAGATT